MNSMERQRALIDFIAQYQEKYQDAPTIREIVRGSRGSSLANIQADVDRLSAQGVLSLVEEQVSGSEPFSAKQVRLGGSGFQKPRAESVAQVSQGTQPRVPIRRVQRSAAKKLNTRKKQYSQFDRRQTHVRNATFSAGRGEIIAPDSRTQRFSPGDLDFQSVVIRFTRLFMDWMRRPAGSAFTAALFVLALHRSSGGSHIGVGNGFSIELSGVRVPVLLLASLGIWALFAFHMAAQAQAGLWPRELVQRMFFIWFFSAAVALLVERTFIPRLGSLTETGIPNLLSGIALLPALALRGMRKRYGIITAGLIAYFLLTQSISSDYRLILPSGTALSAGLLLTPLIAFPAELIAVWLGRNAISPKISLVLVGLALGVGGAFGDQMLYSGSLPGNVLFATIAQASLAGVFAGWLMHFVIELYRSRAARPQAQMRLAV